MRSNTVVFHFYAGFDEQFQNLSSNNFPILCRFSRKFYSDKENTAFIWKNSQKYTRISQKSIKIDKNSSKSAKIVENHYPRPEMIFFGKICNFFGQTFAVFES